MSLSEDIAQKLCDGGLADVDPAHPIRRAADELERLGAERDALRALLAEARGAIFEDADVHDVRERIDAALRSK